MKLWIEALFKCSPFTMNPGDACVVGEFVWFGLTGVAVELEGLV